MENDCNMNKLKTPEKTTPGESNKSLFAQILSWVFTGSILTRRQVVAQLPFIITLMVMSLIYIGNIYSIERLVRTINRVNKENKELYYMQIIQKSKLTEHFSKQSEVARRLVKTGVSESIDPPQKIYSNN